ncbi:COEA1 protein, partial [Polypterus senegalus]|nr:intercellular adhesion molecule 1-like [Polypterus senegalus]MBN3291351.1 COEA1 protein [Polypterus senegalus]
MKLVCRHGTMPSLPLVFLAVILHSANKADGQEPFVCRSPAIADIVVLLDESWSVGLINFRVVRSFLELFVTAFLVGSDKTRVGLAQYGTKPRTAWHLNALSTKEAVISAIREIKYKGGSTRTGLALTYILEKCFTAESGARLGIPKVGIFITDGVSEDDVLLPARRLRDAGVEMFAIGVKNADENELNAIASDPPQSHVYNVPNFKMLSTIVESLTRTVCDRVEQQDRTIQGSSVTSPSTAQSISTDETTIMMIESTAVTTGAENHSSESEASTMLSTQSSVMVTTGFSTATQGSTTTLEANKVTMAELLMDFTTSKGQQDTCDVEFSPARVIVRYGDPVTVTCHTNRTDFRAMGWEASVGAVRVEGSNSAVWNVSSLTVWDAEPKCYLNFRAPPKQCDKRVNLTIYKLPEYLSIDGPEVIEKGKKFNITYEVKDVAPINNVWVKLYRDGVMIERKHLGQNNEKKPESGNVTFTVSADRKDQGWNYTCVVEFDFSFVRIEHFNSSNLLKVTPYAFDEELEILLVNSSEYIEVGASFNATCVLRNSFPMADIQMRMHFNGSECEVDVKQTPEQVSATATLVQPSNLNGTITCTANMRSLSKSSQRNVVGYKLPKPVLKMPNHAHVGEPVMVKCEVNESDTADVVLYMLIPKLNINETKAAGIPIDKTFNATKSHNNMKIICVTEQRTAAVQKQEMMTLTVFYEPSVSLNTSENTIRISHGGDISIQCIADGSPAPEVTWNYKEEPNVQIVNATILNVKTATSMNNGVYKCQANNKHGNATTTFTLEVTSTSSWFIWVIVGAILLIFLIVVGVVCCIYKRKQKRGSYKVCPNGTVIPNGGLEEIPLAPEQKQSMQNGELS